MKYEIAEEAEQEICTLDEEKVELRWSHSPPPPDHLNPAPECQQRRKASSQEVLVADKKQEDEERDCLLHEGQACWVTVWRCGVHGHAQRPR